MEFDFNDDCLFNSDTRRNTEIYTSMNFFRERTKTYATYNTKAKFLEFSNENTSG